MRCIHQFDFENASALSISSFVTLGLHELKFIMMTSATFAIVALPTFARLNFQ